MRTLEDKLAAWKRAYDFVLEELRNNGRAHGANVSSRDHPTHELRAAAARTAASLIEGTDLPDRTPRL